MTAVAPAVRNGLTFSQIAQPGTIERATCAQAGCTKLAEGWTCNVDESTPQGKVWAHWIRHVTHRKGWTEHPTEAGVTVFRFEPGTPCFADTRDRLAQTKLGVAAHTRVVRPYLHVVSNGKARQLGAHIAAAQYRGRAPRLDVVRTHTRPVDWVEDLVDKWNQTAATINGKQ